MKEREDLIKTKELCERILSRDPANKVMLEKLEVVKKKLRLIERRLMDNSDDKKDKASQLKKKSAFKAEYL